MPNITCPQCKAEHPAGTAVCPNCGFEIQKQAQKGATVALMISAAIVIGLCFLLSWIVQNLF